MDYMDELHMRVIHSFFRKAGDFAGKCQSQWLLMHFFNYRFD